MQPLAFPFRLRRPTLFHTVAAAVLAAIIAATPGAFAQQNAPAWRGLAERRGIQAPVPVVLNYQNGTPVLSFDPPYACKVRGSSVAASGQGKSVRTYSLTSSGGHCDTMNSGHLEITEGTLPSGQLLVRAFSYRGAIVHELRLAPQTN